jgi:predicted nucleic acid-binding protein
LPWLEKENGLLAELVDTSIWIGHLHKSDLRLIKLLESSEVLIHSALLGEIAAGSLKKRPSILGDLKMIPRVVEVFSKEH